MSLALHKVSHVSSIVAYCFCCRSRRGGALGWRLNQPEKHAAAEQRPPDTGYMIWWLHKWEFLVQSRAPSNGERVKGVYLSQHGLSNHATDGGGCTHAVHGRIRTTGPSHPKNAGTGHVRFSPTRQILLAPSAKRREVSGESHEGLFASYKEPVVRRTFLHIDDSAE